MTMPRRLTLFLILALTTAFAAAAPAVVAKRPSVGKLPYAKVLNCKTGDTGTGRSATFLGRMRALVTTDRMGMRFTLLERFGDEKLHPVEFPQLRAWRFSKPGVRVLAARADHAQLNG